MVPSPLLRHRIRGNCGSPCPQRPESSAAYRPQNERWRQIRAHDIDIDRLNFDLKHEFVPGRNKVKMDLRERPLPRGCECGDS